MREINFQELTSKDLVDQDALTAAYIDYLKEELGYSDWEAAIAATDLENPYDTEYILQDYEDNYTIDGTEYEVRFCHTDFRYCGLFHLADKPPFEFYMLFNVDSMPDGTVGSYSNAKKKFIL